jgi:RNA recognition motif-containing protein
LSKKLYVGGLSYSTSESSLETLFAQAGMVDSVRIITDRETGRPKGFGFVEMVNDSDASRAITMFNGTDFEGRNITVNEARPQTERPQRSGGGGGGGYGGGSRGGGRY